MATNLRGRQGTVLRYTLRLYHPDAEGDPDLDNPYDLTGYSARFSVKTPALETYDESPELVVADDPGTVTILVSATTTANWSQGDLPYEVELVPPEGEDEAFAILYGVIKFERQYG